MIEHGVLRLAMAWGRRLCAVKDMKLAIKSRLTYRPLTHAPNALGNAGGGAAHKGEAGACVPGRGRAKLDES